jgi:hypothetical protein
VQLDIVIVWRIDHNNSPPLLPNPRVLKLSSPAETAHTIGSFHRTTDIVSLPALELGQLTFFFIPSKIIEHSLALEFWPVSQPVTFSQRLLLTSLSPFPPNLVRKEIYWVIWKGLTLSKSPASSTIGPNVLEVYDGKAFLNVLGGIQALETTRKVTTMLSR